MQKPIPLSTQYCTFCYPGTALCPGDSVPPNLNIWPCCFIEGRNVFTKQSWWLAGMDLQLSRSYQPCMSLAQKKNYVLFLGRVSDLGRTVAMGTIKPTLGLFFCLLLKPFVWWSWTYMVPRSPTLSESILTLSWEHAREERTWQNLHRFSTSSDFPANKNFKFIVGKLSKANQSPGAICWSKSKLKFWSSHNSVSSLSNSSKTAWLHAAFFPLKISVDISWWFISFLCAIEMWQWKLSCSVHAQHGSYLHPWSLCS